MRLCSLNRQERARATSAGNNTTTQQPPPTPETTQHHKTDNDRNYTTATPEPHHSHRHNNLKTNAKLHQYDANLHDNDDDSEVGIRRCARDPHT